MTSKFIKTLNLTSLLLAAPAAWAETIDCTPITTLPTIITVQGIYCFTGNLATSMAIGTAIDIQTNNVVIDLNGWKLGGLAAGAGTQTTGIYAFQRKNITIRNGTIRGSIRGFFYGIRLDDTPPYTSSQGHLIEDIRADKNTYMGFWVEGRGNSVRRNQVVDTGGSTVTNYAYGIQLTGPGARVLNNDISGTAATSSAGAYGLHIHAAPGAVAEGNRIDDVSSGTGFAYGMYIDNSGDTVVEDNHISGVSSGSTGNTYGVYFNFSNYVLVAGNRIISADYGIFYNGSTGKYMDNLTSNVTTPFLNGTAVGTNS